jgi:hypothetical protein
VAVKTTPVVIAQKLDWVLPSQLAGERQQFESTLKAWRDTKNKADTSKLYGFYLSDFYNYGRTLKDWWPSTASEIKAANQRPFQWRETTMLLWRPEPTTHQNPIMVVTYDEISPVNGLPQTKRQYWLQNGINWKIFFEGVIASS